MSENPRRFALLIDGDNVIVQLVPYILERLYKYRRPIVRKVFLNKPSGTSWEQIVHTFSLEPVWVPSNIPGKNASDIALVIDAIDLVYQQPDVTGYCILSSDSDFTRLATYLVGKNKFVLGIGEEKTPASFVQACSKFVYVHELFRLKTRVPLEIEESDPVLKILLQAYKNCSNAGDSVPLHKIGREMLALDPEIKSGDLHDLRQLGLKINALALSYPAGIIKLVRELKNKRILYCVCIDHVALRFVEAYNRAARDMDGWAQLSLIGAELRKDPHHDSGYNYGGTNHKQLLKFVKQIEKAYPLWIRVIGDGKSQPYLVRIYFR